MVNGFHQPPSSRKEQLMRPHHNLEAWNKAVDLVIDIYKSTEAFPKEERYGLTSQIRRAAVSIPANVAEGAGRYSQREFAHFLSNAQGSASELETELIISHRLRYLDETTFSRLIEQLERIGRLITGLSKHVRKSDRNVRG
jgi:four helix bundle protein